jgi:hypothetical protein
MDMCEIIVRFELCSANNKDTRNKWHLFLYFTLGKRLVTFNFGPTHSNPLHIFGLEQHFIKRTIVHDGLFLFLSIQKFTNSGFSF